MEVRVWHKDKLYKGRFYPISTSALTEAVAGIRSEHFLKVSFSTYKMSPRRRARIKGYYPSRDNQFDVLLFGLGPIPVELSLQKGSSTEEEESAFNPCRVDVNAVDEVVLKMVKESLSNGGMSKIVDWLEDMLPKRDFLRSFQLIVTCDGKSVEYLTFEH